MYLYFAVSAAQVHHLSWPALVPNSLLNLLMGPKVEQPMGHDLLNNNPHLLVPRPLFFSVRSVVRCYTVVQS